MKQKVYWVLLDKAKKLNGLDENLKRIEPKRDIEEVHKEWVDFLNFYSIKQIHKRKKRHGCWFERVGSQEKPARDKDHIIVNDPFVVMFRLVDHEHHGLKVPKELALKIAMLEYVA